MITNVINHVYFLTEWSCAIFIVLLLAYIGLYIFGNMLRILNILIKILSGDKTQ